MAIDTTRCKFWLPRKNRFCANSLIDDSQFCGNHKPRSDEQWIQCPIDPSHSVLSDNLESHVKRCPFLKQAQSLALQPFYQKGINSGEDDSQTIRLENSALPDSKPGLGSSDHVTSESKRNSVYALSAAAFSKLIETIKSVHESTCKDIPDSHKITEACGVWIRGEIDGKLPFQEKHVVQQASILGNLEEFGILSRDSVGTKNGESDEDDNGVPSVVEFGAGRGYLTQVLADCYGIEKVFLVERKSYKLKADRSLRQIERLKLERLRIDIEDLNLNAVKSLQDGPYLAIGKHLCGPATDMTLRCCINEESGTECGPKAKLTGLAIATCCHHLCQWKNYINKRFFLNLGITKEDFHMITWFTSWAVDADHGSGLSDWDFHLGDPKFDGNVGVEEIVRKMEVVERASLGFMCKQIIDMGRTVWMKERGLKAKFVKYVPPTVSPENHLLITKPII